MFQKDKIQYQHCSFYKWTNTYSVWNKISVKEKKWHVCFLLPHVTIILKVHNTQYIDKKIASKINRIIKFTGGIILYTTEYNMYSGKTYLRQKQISPYKVKWIIFFYAKKLYWSLGILELDTVLVLFKFTKFAVALRLRCGSCKLIFWHYFIIFR